MSMIGGSEGGTVLTSAAPDQAARWRRGERLDRLFEDKVATACGNRRWVTRLPSMRGTLS